MGVRTFAKSLNAIGFWWERQHNGPTAQSLLDQIAWLGPPPMAHPLNPRDFQLHLTIDLLAP